MNCILYFHVLKFRYIGFLGLHGFSQPLRADTKRHAPFYLIVKKGTAFVVTHCSSSSLAMSFRNCKIVLG